MGYVEGYMREGEVSEWRNGLETIIAIDGCVDKDVGSQHGGLAPSNCLFAL